jgi:hypothetical protein
LEEHVDFALCLVVPVSKVVDDIPIHLCIHPFAYYMKIF